MSLQNSLFLEDVEYDVTLFARDEKRKRVLVFPPVNSYRRFLIHQLVQERFAELLHTFSIGQGDARRTVVCYKVDLIRDPKLNGVECQPGAATKSRDTMGVEGQRSPSASPERARVQRQAKSVPKVEIYRPPAARRARNDLQNNTEQIQLQPTVDTSSAVKSNRQRRPDRAVYVPRHRRSLEAEGSPQPVETSRTSRTLRDNSTPASHGNPKTNVNPALKGADAPVIQENARCTKVKSNECGSTSINLRSEKNQSDLESESAPAKDVQSSITSVSSTMETCDMGSNERLSKEDVESADNNVPIESNDSTTVETKCERTDVSQPTMVEEEKVSDAPSENKITAESVKEFVDSEPNAINKDAENCDNKIPPFTKDRNTEEPLSNRDEITNHRNTQMARQNMVSDVLIISDSVHKKPKIIKEVTAVPTTPPEKKVKKIERQKSKPAPPPAPPVKINRDECDWDSLFDDNGDCLDPTLIEELTSAVGDVMIEQPKNDYKPYTKHVEVSSDEFAHVIEIYNFPSEFKTSDLAAVFSPFKNGGFELKWVDDTHCLGVFSSPLIAAEVLASDHAFVKTRPLSEATALSKTKAKRSAEFLQPYRSRPETCAALARRLVTGALGVKLATARQEREHEKNVLREAKEKRRLANKQREDAWEGIVPEK